jgi:hypothetical protein
VFFRKSRAFLLALDNTVNSHQSPSGAMSAQPAENTEGSLMGVGRFV